MQQINLRKKDLLYILDQVDDDAEIQVMVNADHVVKDGSIDKFTRVGLADGAGLNDSKKSVLLMTRKISDKS